MDNSKNLKDTKGIHENYITVCICTYNRPILLRKLIHELENQENTGILNFNVVIVDNDPLKSAENTVKELQTSSNIEIKYFHEEKRGISYARNKTIMEADGDYIVFIDDDEYPHRSWLRTLYDAIKQYSADGILGPVEPEYDNDTPIWLRKSGLLNRDRFKTGEKISNPKYTRTGNVIFKKNLFEDLEAPFDPRYGKTGGGDVEFFERMIKRGKLFVWCDEAIVFEHIEEKRREKSYYIKRAFTRGLTNSMRSFSMIGILKSIVAVPVYTCIVPVAVLAGKHVAIRYTVKLCDHLGKLLGCLGIKVVKERPY